MVVLHVFPEHLPVGKGRKEPQGELTEGIIDLSVTADAAVHAVMTGDEQSGVQIGLYQDVQVQERRCVINLKNEERVEQVSTPEKDDS